MGLWHLYPTMNRALQNPECTIFLMMLGSDVGAVRKIDQCVVRVVLGSVLHIESQGFEGAYRSLEIVGFVEYMADFHTGVGNTQK